MSKTPWISIIGIGEDGLDGLSVASQKRVKNAEIIWGAPRHLALAKIDERAHEWPVPFSLEPMLEKGGKNVVVLVSGDPFWFGAGSIIADQLDKEEWQAFPLASSFSLVAARMGWALQDCYTHGLHARDFETTLTDLQNGNRLILLMRDGGAVRDYAKWLANLGFSESEITILEALGGSSERVRKLDDLKKDDEIEHPVALGVLVRAQGLSRANGLPDEKFESDGQITKRPARALALSALAPRDGEILWDLGAGCGSVSVEWCLSAPRTNVYAVEKRKDRARYIQENAKKYGLSSRLHIHQGDIAALIEELPSPNAVFFGGGMTLDIFDQVWSKLEKNTRLTAHAVTLETEGLLHSLAKKIGGDLMRVEISHAEPIADLRSWKAARPLTQWNFVK